MNTLNGTALTRWLPATLSLGLLLLTACVVQKGGMPREALAAEEEPQVSVAMRDYGGRPVVSISINGTGPRTFILDTGASVSVIDSTLAAALNLPVVGSRMVTSPMGDGSNTSSIVSADEIVFEGIRREDQDLYVLDLASMFPGSDVPVGVLSYRFFDGYRLVIDYPGNLINAYPGSLPPADGETIFGYESEVLEIPVDFNGREIALHIDTGAPSSFTLPLETAGYLDLKTELVIVGQGQTVDAKFDIYSATLSGTASIGRLKFEGPQLGFIDGIPVGNIGNEILSQLVLTIDPAGRRLRLDRPPGVTVSSDGSGPMRIVKNMGGNKRYGIRMHGIDGSPIQVAGVDPGSPAEECGLEMGDRINTINGVPVEGMSRGERISALKGSPLTVIVNRDGEALQIDLKLD